MKRFLVLVVLSLLVLATGRERAAAWCNFRFSAGVNMSWQSANNCVLWGLFKNGPAPQGFFPGYDGAAAYGYGGYNPYGYNYNSGANSASPYQTQQTAYHQPNASAAAGYTPVGYYPATAYGSYYGYYGAASNYYMPYYSYPSYWYPYPSYWYGH